MRVDRIAATFDVPVIIRHFPLHPETPPDGLTLEELFAGRDIDILASQARLTQLINAEGLSYGRRVRTYNSRLAQEMAAWAETRVGGSRIHRALFEAYFVEDINLAKIENLVGIAESISLPPDEAQQKLQTRSFREAVDADWQQSRILGITGVPTFVSGSRVLVGAQPYEQLESLLEGAGAKRKRTG